jgi:hypothetical protein
MAIYKVIGLMDQSLFFPLHKLTVKRTLLNQLIYMKLLDCQELENDTEQVETTTRELGLVA